MGMPYYTTPSCTTSAVHLTNKHRILLTLLWKRVWKTWQYFLKWRTSAEHVRPLSSLMHMNVTGMKVLVSSDMIWCDIWKMMTMTKWKKNIIKRLSRMTTILCLIQCDKWCFFFSFPCFISTPKHLLTFPLSYSYSSSCPLIHCNFLS